MSVCSQFVYRLNAIPIKIPANYSMDIDKLILKFIWRGKRPRIANSILNGKNKVGRLMLPDLKSESLYSHSNQNSLVL